MSACLLLRYATTTKPIKLRYGMDNGILDWIGLTFRGIFKSQKAGDQFCGSYLISFRLLSFQSQTTNF